MRNQGSLLFNAGTLWDCLREYERRMCAEIDDIEGNRLLNTSADQLATFFVDKFRITCPALLRDQIAVDHAEVQIDVSGDHRRDIFDRRQPFYIKGIAITFHVPFEGDSSMFRFRPSSFTLNPPHATIGQGELQLIYELAESDSNSAKSTFESELASIEQYLGSVRGEVEGHNSQLLAKAQSRIAARREKLLKDRGLVEGLGYPVRRRQGESATYSVPVSRKKLSVVMPEPSKVQFAPEPALNDDDYEEILRAISNMVMVIERSPASFQKMQEEDLRNQLLIPLNGLFEGQATGETFNFEGKTDILIRVNGKNIFVGECKFWGGPKTLSDAIDQLLGYATWRDTKTAIIVFNRTKQFSEVLQKIQAAVKAHPNCVRQLAYRSESGFRFTFHHRDDKNRTMTLTVLAFEVPK